MKTGCQNVKLFLSGPLADARDRARPLSPSQWLSRGTFRKTNSRSSSLEEMSPTVHLQDFAGNVVILDQKNDRADDIVDTAGTFEKGLFDRL